MYSLHENVYHTIPDERLGFGYDPVIILWIGFFFYEMIIGMALIFTGPTHQRILLISVAMSHLDTAKYDTYVQLIKPEHEFYISS